MKQGVWKVFADQSVPGKSSADSDTIEVRFGNQFSGKVQYSVDGTTAGTTGGSVSLYLYESLDGTTFGLTSATGYSLIVSGLSSDSDGIRTVNVGNPMAKYVKLRAVNSTTTGSTINVWFGHV